MQWSDAGSWQWRVKWDRVSGDAQVERTASKCCWCPGARKSRAVGIDALAAWATSERCGIKHKWRCWEAARWGAGGPRLFKGLVLWGRSGGCSGAPQHQRLTPGAAAARVHAAQVAPDADRWGGCRGKAASRDVPGLRCRQVQGACSETRQVVVVRCGGRVGWVPG